MIWLYNLFLTLSALVWVPWMLARAKRRKEPVIWKERSGDYPFQLKKGEKRLWLHAVSVGEVVAALPILREIRRQDASVEIVLSVTTSSGHQTAMAQADGLFDHLVYFPIDVYRFVLAALVRVRPTVFAVMETELWMNFLDAAKHIGVTTLLINGRISDRSYPRSMSIRPFYRSLLRNLDRCLMQSDTDADRIKALGGVNVEVYGNCKFDQAVEGLDADPDHWRKELGISDDRPVIVVGSSRGEHEEAMILQGLRGIFAQVVWAPRHLERVEAIESALKHEGCDYQRRSMGGTFGVPRFTVPDFLILDTYGELSQVYCVADVVVIGGGFDNLGGQNLLQPLAHGKPVVHGPHMQNFRDIADSAFRAGATRVAKNASELEEALFGLLQDPDLRSTMGAAANEVVEANLGASRRYSDAILAALNREA